jgi:DHA2 family multidrug resistance protein
VAYLRQDQMGNSTGLYNLMRNLGGSFGIAFVTTMIDRGAQKHQGHLIQHVTPFDPAAVDTLRALHSALAPYTDKVTASTQAHQLLYDMTLAQAKLWAFVDNFRLFGVVTLACLPLILLLKRLPRHGAPKVDAH